MTTKLAVTIGILCILPQVTLAAGRVSATAISGNTTEAGGTATFTVTLDEPIICEAPGTCNVTIPFTSSNTAEGNVAASLVIDSTEWFVPKTVTVTGVNDDIDDGNVTYTIVLGAVVSNSEYYSNFNPADVSATNTDNDTAGITVSPVSGTVVEGGTSGTFTVALNTQPTSTVDVALSVTDQITTTPTSLQFTTSNWSTPQTVTISAVDDSAVEDAQSGTLTFAVTSSDVLYNAYALSSVTVDITDNDIEPITDSEVTPEVVTFTVDNRYLSVLVNGEVTDTAVVGRRHVLQQPVTSFKLKHARLFTDESYSTVALLRVNHYQAKLFVFRLTADHQLVKKQVRILPIRKQLAFQLKLLVGGQRIKTIIGKGDSQQVNQWQLTETGELVALPLN